MYLWAKFSLTLIVIDILLIVIDILLNVIDILFVKLNLSKVTLYVAKWIKFKKVISFRMFFYFFQKC